jgi:hypothetical protein
LLCIDNEDLRKGNKMIKEFIALREKFYKTDVLLGIIDSNNTEVLNYMNRILKVNDKED